MNSLLWILQVGLAALFAYSGSQKLLDPVVVDGVLAGTSTTLVILIGILEVMASLGLILPQLTSILPKLTPTAAAGSALLMIGAVFAQLNNGTSALLPAVVFVLAAFVAYGRFVLVPAK
ncbi:MAG: DoxX family protein [Chloroflexota bacterium]